MTGGVFFTGQRITRNREIVISQYQRSLEESQEKARLVVATERAARIVRSYLVAPEDVELQRLSVARREFDDALERIKTRVPERQPLLESIGRSQARVREIADSLIEARRAGELLESVRPRFEQELQPARQQLDGEIATLEGEMRSLLALEVEHANHVLQQGVYLFAISMGASLVLVFWMVAVLARLYRQRAERERAIQLSEAKLAGMVTIAADAIIAVDEQQRITLFNKGAETIFGFQAEEVVGQPLDMLLPERVRSIHVRHVEKLAAGPTIARHMGQRRDIYGRRKNGEEFPADAAISRLEVNGKVLMTAVVRDVSESRRVEHEQRFLSAATAALAESLDYHVTFERVAQLVVPTLADGCAIHRMEGSAFVPVAVAHVDAATDQALRGALERHPIPLDSQHGIAHVARTAKAQLIPSISEDLLQEMARHFEPYQLLLRSGCRSLLFVPLLVRGQCTGVISMMAGASGRALGERDLVLAEELARRVSLTIDNALLYAEAQRATRARDEMLGVVAHDLRSPVNTVTLSASFIRRRLKKQGGDPEQLESIEGILRATSSMNRLIGDLLDVVRMESGHLSMQRSRWPAAQLVNDAAEAHRAQLASARLELRLEFPGELPEVFVDAERIHQVFTNLMGNAIKFTPPGGVVTIGAALEEGAVVFRLTDSGPGIPEEQLPHLFDRFWQARPHDRRGAGLGLAIAKGIVEAHGGRIWARSKPGEGSTFFFSIPLGT